MSAADRTEKVLRDIHVLFSKAEPYNGSKRDVIVNKNEMMDLLKELNACMYDMIDEHELSQTKKDKANREMQKQGDDIIFAASRKAEDIYAASIMYTDNALNDIQQIIEDAKRTVEAIRLTLNDWEYTIPQGMLATILDRVEYLKDTLQELGKGDADEDDV